MKAYEISLFVVILSATIGFINGLGLFSYQYEMVPQSKYIEWNVSQIGEDYGNVTTQISPNFNIMGMLSEITFAIACLYPTLVKVFHIPILLSALLQVAIYMVYAIGILQFITGRSFKNIE